MVKLGICRWRTFGMLTGGVTNVIVKVIHPEEEPARCGRMKDVIYVMRRLCFVQQTRK